MSCLPPCATEISTEHMVQNACSSLLFDLVIESKLFCILSFVLLFPFLHFGFNYNLIFVLFPTLN